MADDEHPIVTVADLKAATWKHGGRASAASKGGGRMTVTLAEATVDGVTVRASKTEYSDGRKPEAAYAVHGRTVYSLEELAAVLSRRWEVGDDARGAVGGDD